jgi:hypothetical protein
LYLCSEITSGQFGLRASVFSPALSLSSEWKWNWFFLNPTLMWLVAWEDFSAGLL